MRNFTIWMNLFWLPMLVAQNPLEHSICKPNKWGNAGLVRRMNTETTYNFDIGYHRCEFTVFPRSNADIQGSVMSRVKVSKNTDTLYMDMRRELILDSVKHAGNTLSYRHIGDRVWLINSQGWAAGQIDSFTLYYHGTPNGTGNRYFSRDKHQTDWIISSLSQPYGAYYWWPCKQTLTDKIDSIDIHINTHRGMLAASQGLLIDSAVINPLVVKYHWQHRYPIATYLVSIAVSNYKELKSYYKTNLHSDSMLFLNYIFPQSVPDAEQNLDTTYAIFKGFEKAYGAYPFWKEKYGHAQFMQGGGMEHQTMSSMSSFNTDLVAHELAHMWWGDAVTCTSWEDLWLNEGFATYSTCLCRELLIDSATFREIKWWLRLMSTVPSSGSVLASDTGNVSALFNQTLRYNRGGFLLHMVRRKMGDSAFFAGLKTYVTQSKMAYGFSSTVLFKEWMEASCNCSLDTLFNDFYYNQGIPLMYINWEQNGLELKVKVKQVPSVSGAKFFHIPIPLTIITEDGTKKYVTEYPMTHEAEYTYKVPYQVKEIIFDEAINILAIDTTKGINFNLEKKELVVWPNPAGNILNVLDDKHNNEPIIIMDIKGAKVMEIESKNWLDRVIELDIRNLRAGTYVLLLKNSKRSSTFVKVKS